MRTVICDIDGTLANLDHRLHHVKPKEGKVDWDAFFEAAKDDVIIEPIRMLVVALRSRYQIALVTGRPEKTKAATKLWLGRECVPYDALYMRPDGDTRADYIVKEEILDKMLAAGHEVQMVIDDRQTVVDMWRRRGLVCLQCATWNDRAIHVTPGILTIMVGPSGAGKTTWLNSEEAKSYGIKGHQVVSSDLTRYDLCGDFQDQSKNEEVFVALHAVVKARLEHGLNTVVDATNIRRKDRLANVTLASGGKVRYMVIDRPEVDKRKDGGWRNQIVGFDLIGKHQQTFESQLRDILSGDNLPNIEVIDLRAK